MNRKVNVIGVVTGPLAMANGGSFITFTIYGFEIKPNPSNTVVIPITTKILNVLQMGLTGEHRFFLSQIKTIPTHQTAV